MFRGENEGKGRTSPTLFQAAFLDSPCPHPRSGFRIPTSAGQHEDKKTWTLELRAKLRKKRKSVWVCGRGWGWGWRLRKCQVIPGNSRKSWRARRMEPCLSIKGKSDRRTPQKGFKRACGSFRIKLDNVSKAPGTGPNT